MKETITLQKRGQSIVILYFYHSLTDTIFLLYLLMYALGKKVLVPRASPVNAQSLKCPSFRPLLPEGQRGVPEVLAGRPRPEPQAQLCDHKQLTPFWVSVR